MTSGTSIQMTETTISETILAESADLNMLTFQSGGRERRIKSLTVDKLQLIRREMAKNRSKMATIERIYREVEEAINSEVNV